MGPNDTGLAAGHSDAASSLLGRDGAAGDRPAHGPKTHGPGLIGPKPSRLLDRSANKKRYISEKTSECRRKYGLPGLFPETEGAGFPISRGLQPRKNGGRRSLHRERSKVWNRLWHPGRLVRNYGPHRRRRAKHRDFTVLPSGYGKSSGVEVFALCVR